MNPTDTSAPTTPATPTPATPTVPQKSKKKLGLIALVVAALVVVLGGSAGAYYGIIVPNKPENILKTAVQNFTKKDTFTAKGKIDVTASETSSTVDMNMLHVDSTKKVALVDMTLTMSGIKLPVEARFVDGNAYVKLGDLSTIKSLLGAYAGGDSSPVIDEIEKKVSNQWVEIDKTLLSSATSSATESKCSPEEVTMRTRAAVNEAVSAAVDGEDQVYTIQKTSSDTVDGQKTKKLELTLDKSKLAAFGKKVEDLPAAKELAKCSESAVESAETTASGETMDLTALNVWVDGSKQIKRVELKLAVGNDEAKTAMGIDMTMVKDSPTVEKPAGAKPLMQLYGELSSLLGMDGSSLGGIDDLSNSLSL